MAGPAGGTNPIAVIDDNPMSVRQWIVVVLMILLNALDGFDVLSSAFAAPGITMEWGIPRSELGIVLSPMTPRQQDATTSADDDEAADKNESR